jgi:hypothetical protein
MTSRSNSHGAFSSVPKMSILMPVYNEERWIRKSVNSVLAQKTTFDFELIVVDDASTDGTPEILQKIQANNPLVKVLRNAKNLGKGFSKKRAYQEARGDYFHVLDGDDCFVSRRKLQTQVEFLEQNRDFFAVGHNTMLLVDGAAQVMNSRIHEETWDNELCLSGRVYCHTSSLMFRKTTEELPDFFMEPEFRGDTALFLFLAYTTGLKCKYLPNVWSIYNFHGAGLWSSMDAEAKRDLNIRIIEACKEKIVPETDLATIEILDRRINHVRTRPLESDKMPVVEPLNEFLSLGRRASSVVFKYREEAFNNMYAFRLVDELAEAVGRCILLTNDTEVPTTDFSENDAILLVSGLVPGGGGIFREIRSFVEMLLSAGYRVGIVSTQSIKTDTSLFPKYFGSPNVWIWCANEEDNLYTQAKNVIKTIRDARPKLLFPFITHNDVVGNAAIQHDITETTILDYVYDHGLSLGILNSSIDKVIVKTYSQARALQNMAPDMDFCLVPPFMKDLQAPYHAAYEPLPNGVVNTATAAARAYKVEGGYKYSYTEMLPIIMATSGGRHTHYGPLSDDGLKTIFKGMDALGLARSQFRHIRWTNQLGRSLIEEKTSLFISPFPVCSARIAMEVAACGIPSANHVLETTGIPQALEFTDPNQFVWRKPSELLAIIANVSEDDLRAKSKSARKHFEANNDMSVAAKQLTRLTPLVTSESVEPEFVLSEFSKRFVVEVNTRAFAGRTNFSR